MTPAQRAAALRLADYISADAWPGGLNAAKLDEAAALLRELAAEPAQVPVAEYRLAETDIYDFAGWLTTRPGVIPVGSSCEAGPMAEAVGEYLRTFPERFAPQRQPLPPDAHDDTGLLFRALNALTYYRQQTRPIEVAERVMAALHERLAHGIGETK